jgi:hypothetical protein
MKALFLLLTLSFLLNNMAYCQAKTNSNNNDFSKFIKSFPVQKSFEVLNFRVIALDVWKKKSMNISRGQALKYIYNNDTAMLYCTSKSINQETEKIEAIFRTENFPKRCFRLDFENYQLVAYYYGLCQNPDEWQYSIIKILLIDTHHVVRDNMMVYKDDGYDSSITGLLNPINGKIFLLNERTGYVYRVNEQTLKFEVIEKDVADFSTDDCMKALESFGWKEVFME